VRELITDDSDCPLFKLGVIQEWLSLLFLLFSGNVPEH